jgi:hypothetical protein
VGPECRGFSVDQQRAFCRPDPSRPMLSVHLEEACVLLPASPSSEAGAQKRACLAVHAALASPNPSGLGDAVAGLEHLSLGQAPVGHGTVGPGRPSTHARSCELLVVRAQACSSLVQDAFARMHAWSAVTVATGDALGAVPPQFFSSVRLGSATVSWLGDHQPLITAKPRGAPRNVALR